MTQFDNWTAYVKMTTGTPPRPLYQQAIARFEIESLEEVELDGPAMHGPKHWASVRPGRR